MVDRNQQSGATDSLTPEENQDNESKERNFTPRSAVIN